MNDRITRRALVAGATALPALAPAWARAQQGFPNRPVTIINGYSAGGQTDLATRMLAEQMTAALGQSVLVENRVGGATAIASTAVAQARPDGYTLLAGTSSLAINPTLQPSLTPREPQKELAPVGMVYRGAFVLHVHPDLPVKTLPEFIAYAKANPGKLNYGSGGSGTVVHLAMEMLRQKAGIDLVHVPYRGGTQTLLDLQSGRIQAVFQSPIEALPSLEAGKTRAIAISSRERLNVLPEVPTLAEFLPGFEAVLWLALFAPAGTPAPVLARLTSAVNRATGEPGFRRRMAEVGLAVETGDAEMLRGLLVADTANWRAVITESKITID